LGVTTLAGSKGDEGLPIPRNEPGCLCGIFFSSALSLGLSFIFLSNLLFYSHTSPRQLVALITTVRHHT